MTADKNQRAQDNAPAASSPDTSARNNQNDNGKLRLMALPPPRFTSFFKQHFTLPFLILRERTNSHFPRWFLTPRLPEHSPNTAPSLIWMVKVHFHLHIDRVPDSGFCHLPKIVLIVSSHSSSSCCEWGTVTFAQYQYMPPSRHPNCKHVQVNAFSPPPPPPPPLPSF